MEITEVINLITTNGDAIITAIIGIGTSLVTIASIITRLTKNTEDDEKLSKFSKFIKMLSIAHDSKKKK